MPCKKSRLDARKAAALARRHLRPDPRSDAGPPISNYTGVLIGATVIPVWNANAATLPLHFGMSGLNSAVAILELRGHNHRALNLLGAGASLVETAEGIRLETTAKPAIEPLKRGVSGLIARAGGMLSGPIPLFFV